jgi:hypothetical protein
MIRGGWSLTLLGVGALLHAQDIDASLGTSNEWKKYDWLAPAEAQKQQDATGMTVKATTSQDTNDPFATITNGSLWQQKYGVVYTQRLVDAMALSYETSAVTLTDGTNPYQPVSETGDDLSRAQKVGLQFQPVEQFKLTGNVHDAVNDTALPQTSTTVNGMGVTAESHLPFNSVLTLGLNSDETAADPGYSAAGQDTAYDAQLSQPIGKIPVTAVFKGHYDETSAAGVPQTRAPSLEQSLVWKPGGDTTLQMGLRQQQYQNFPGMTSDYNQAVFADWSQKVAPEMTWHSYAEMLDSRSNLNVAPGISTSGSNGTPQSTTPGGPSVSSSVPLLAQDKTLTFSTGPSFKLEKDISASIEYSNRWDQNPQPGTIGQEQRVSVSVKGSC